MAANRPLAVLGATGYTGQLVAAVARDLGVRLRLIGRRKEALEQVAQLNDETAVADARDRASVRDAVEGCFALVSTAGPFLPLGLGPVEAAIAAGIHYLDSSGEQAFFAKVAELDSEARTQGVVLAPCCGFDFAAGDLAAKLAAEGLGACERIDVAYALTGGRWSRGSRKTVAEVLRQPQVARVDGQLVKSRLGATTRKIDFPWGRRTVIEWPGAEPLTVPRYTDVATVRSYLRAPRILALASALSFAASPAMRLSAKVGRDPSADRRKSSRFAVVAEAVGENGTRRATLAGSDSYQLTARLLVLGALLLRDWRREGGLASPAQVLDLDMLAPDLGGLLRVASVESSEAGS